MTPNRGMPPPVRRFLSNYFDLLLALSLTLVLLGRAGPGCCRPGTKHINVVTQTRIQHTYNPFIAKYINLRNLFHCCYFFLFFCVDFCCTFCWVLSITLWWIKMYINERCQRHLTPIRVDATELCCLCDLMMMMMNVIGSVVVYLLRDRNFFPNKWKFLFTT